MWEIILDWYGWIEFGWDVIVIHPMHWVRLNTIPLTFLAVLVIAMIVYFLFIRTNWKSKYNNLNDDYANLSETLRDEVEKSEELENTIDRLTDRIEGILYDYGECTASLRKQEELLDKCAVQFLEIRKKHATTIFELAVFQDEKERKADEVVSLIKKVSPLLQKEKVLPSNFNNFLKSVHTFIETEGQKELGSAEINALMKRINAIQSITGIKYIPLPSNFYKDINFIN